jgi:hypothetical protein
MACFNKNPAQEINSKSLWLFYGLDISVLPYGDLITHIPLPLQKMEEGLLTCQQNIIILSQNNLVYPLGLEVVSAFNAFVFTLPSSDS